MKSLNYFLVLTLGTLIFSSCESNNDSPILNSNQLKFQASIGDITRANGTSWANGDAIGIYALKAGETFPSGIYESKNNIKYTTTGDGTFTTESNFISFPDDGQLSFIAYYPYTDPLTNYAYNIDVTDQGDPTAIDLLYSNNATSLDKATSTVNLQFKHMLSMMNIDISSGNGISSLNGMKASIKNLKTTGTFNLADGTISAGTTTESLTPVLSGTESSKTLSAIVLPQQNFEDATVSVTLDGKTYEWKPQSQELDQSKKYTYSLQLSSNGLTAIQPSATIVDWEVGNTDSGTTILTPVEEAQFSADKATVTLPASGTLTDNVALTTQTDQAWTASSDQTWLSVTASGTGSGNLTLTAEENTATTSRTATVTVTPTGSSTLSPVTITVTQEAADSTPPAGSSTLLFPSSDFEDWNTFTGSLNSYGMKDAEQSLTGGRNSSSALHINTTPSSNDYVFTAVVPGSFSASGKTKISFYIKGTAAGKSLSINVYQNNSTSGYAIFNLGDCSSDATIQSSGSNDYTGSIDTNGNWVKITLNIADVASNISTTAGNNLFALKVGKTAPYDLYVDDITIE